MTDRILKKRFYFVIVWIICMFVVFSPQGIEMYDNYMDDEANPGYTGLVSPAYLGGWYEFSQDRDYPHSKVIVNFKTSAHDYNRTYHPDSSDWPVGFSCPHYWVVKRVTPGPDVFERVRVTINWYVPRFEPKYWPEFNITTYDFSHFELVQGHDWFSEEPYFDSESNLTLSFDWKGWI